MSSLSCRHAFAYGMLCLAALMFFPAVPAYGEDAENARPATSPEEFKQRHAELTAQANEVGKEISALTQELKARQEEIDRHVEIQNLRKQATEANQAVAAFLKTDATLVGLRQAREKTQAAVEAARLNLLDSTDEAKALYKQRAEFESKDAMLAFNIRETEFVMERHVLPRLYRDNEDLLASRTRKETLRRQMQQSRSDTENNSMELKALRAEVDKARAVSDAARPALSNDLTRARAEKEAALRVLTTEELKDEDKAVTDARNNAAKVRADIAAKDEEAVALTEHLAGLNKQRANLNTLHAEKQASLRALRAKAPGSGDKPPADARNADAKSAADAAAVDKEAVALTETLAALDNQRAELDYQIALVEIKLREGVGRRMGLDPNVRKADAAAANAEKARRAKEETSPALAAARNELDELRRKIGELEAAANAAPEAAATRADRAAKEKRLSDLRAKLGADAVAGLNPAFDEAAKAEDSLRVKKLAADDEAGRLSRAKEETSKERSALGARRQEIETELRKLYDKTADAESIKPFNEAAVAASKAYDRAYATSEIQKLLDAEKKAAAALAQRTAEWRNADEKCSALNARVATARAKSFAITAEIRELVK